jgi:peroxiredoxin
VVLLTGCPRLGRLLLLGLALALLASGPAGAQAGGPAPRGEVVTVTGERIPLDRGQVQELTFVARWCPPCERELAAARRRAGQFRRQGYQVIIVGVAARQTEAEFVRWARDAGFDGALVYDADGSLERAFRAASLPWHVVVDAQGRVAHAGDAAPAAERIGGWVGGRRPAGAR